MKSSSPKWHSVIKVFGGVFVLSRCFLDCSVGVWVFVTGLSQISSFFSSGAWPYAITPFIDQTIHQPVTLLPNWTLNPSLTFLPNCKRFPFNVCNGCGLLVQIGTYKCSNVEISLACICLIFGLWILNIPRYFYFASFFLLHTEIDVSRRSNVVSFPPYAYYTVCDSFPSICVYNE